MHLFSSDLIARLSIQISEMPCHGNLTTSFQIYIKNSTNSASEQLTKSQDLPVLGSFSPLLRNPIMVSQPALSTGFIFQFPPTKNFLSDPIFVLFKSTIYNTTANTEIVKLDNPQPAITLGKCKVKVAEIESCLLKSNTQVNIYLEEIEWIKTYQYESKYVCNILHDVAIQLLCHYSQRDRLMFIEQHQEQIE